jgi:hypothetical protein
MAYKRALIRSLNMGWTNGADTIQPMDLQLRICNYVSQMFQLKTSGLCHTER